MQDQIADDEIEAPVAKRRQLGIGRDALALRQSEGPDRRFGHDDALRARPLRQPAGEDAVARAEIEHIGKFPVDQVEAVEQPLGDFVMQKIDRARRRAVAVGAPGAAIEQRGR